MQPLSLTLSSYGPYEEKKVQLTCNIIVNTDKFSEPSHKMTKNIKIKIATFQQLSVQ